jgi:hypothetical protein
MWWTLVDDAVGSVSSRTKFVSCKFTSIDMDGAPHVMDAYMPEA